MDTDTIDAATDADETIAALARAVERGEADPADLDSAVKLWQVGESVDPEDLPIEV